LRWRPAYALPAVAALALFLWLDDGQPVPTPVTPAQVLVEFRLSAAQATHVALAGDFTNWKPTYALVRGEPGVWTIVVPLAPGVHDYAFIVDGERWIADPMAPAVADGFGGLNSRIAVLPPDLAVRS
jgi:1,4-alpha-glucan branching enzyme